MPVNIKQHEEIKPLSFSESSILKVIPQRFVGIIHKYLMNGSIEEIRFRVNRPVQIVGADEDFLLTQYGNFSITEANEMLKAICGQSVYAMENELCMGFVTLEGGARVGISGRPLVEGGRIIRLTNISSFNIRIAREAVGCAERFADFFIEDGRPQSSLIISPPGAGKTTFLRDLARCLSDGIGIDRPFRVSIADERNELSGSIDAVPTLNIGRRTDIMALVPKRISIPLLIRSMSPDVIITDELSGSEDMEAVEEASKCGVVIIASVHASGAEQLSKRMGFLKAHQDGCFPKAFRLFRHAKRINLVPLNFENLF